MRKGRIIGLMVMVFLVWMSGVGWGAKRIYVHPDGDDINGDGETIYSTICIDRSTYVGFWAHRCSCIGYGWM